MTLLPTGKLLIMGGTQGVGAGTANNPFYEVYDHALRVGFRACGGRGEPAARGQTTSTWQAHPSACLAVSSFLAKEFLCRICRDARHALAHAPGRGGGSCLVQCARARVGILLPCER